MQTNRQRVTKQAWSTQKGYRNFFVCVPTVLKKKKAVCEALHKSEKEELFWRWFGEFFIDYCLLKSYTLKSRSKISETAKILRQDQLTKRRCCMWLTQRLPLFCIPIRNHSVLSIMNTLVLLPSALALQFHIIISWMSWVILLVVWIKSPSQCKLLISFISSTESGNPNINRIIQHLCIHQISCNEPAFMMQTPGASLASLCLSKQVAGLYLKKKAVLRKKWFKVIFPKYLRYYKSNILHFLSLKPY